MIDTTSTPADRARRRGRRRSPARASRRHHDRVRVNGTLVTPAAVTSTDAAIARDAAGGLRAGLNPCRSCTRSPLGDPPTPHPGVGFESNVAALVLAPQITTAPPVTVAAGGTLTLDVEPPVGREQRVAVLLGDEALAVAPRPPSDPAASASCGRRSAPISRPARTCSASRSTAPSARCESTTTQAARPSSSTSAR